MLISVIKKQILLLSISCEDLPELINATSGSCDKKVCNSLVTIVCIAYNLYMLYFYVIVNVIM